MRAEESPFYENFDCFRNICAPKHISHQKNCCPCSTWSKSLAVPYFIPTEH